MSFDTCKEEYDLSNYFGLSTELSLVLDNL